MKFTVAMEIMSCDFINNNYCSLVGMMVALKIFFLGLLPVSLCYVFHYARKERWKTQMRCQGSTD